MAYLTLANMRYRNKMNVSEVCNLLSGMRVFSFLNDFRFLSPKTILIIEQNAPKCSKLVYLFHNFPGGTPLQDIFSFFHRKPLPCLLCWHVQHYCGFISRILQYSITLSRRTAVRSQSGCVCYLRDNATQKFLNSDPNRAGEDDETAITTGPRNMIPGWLCAGVGFSVHYILRNLMLFIRYCLLSH